MTGSSTSLGNFVQRYPQEFREAFGEPTACRGGSVGAACTSAKACWHCHSQFVHISNESSRYGDVSQT